MVPLGDFVVNFKTCFKTTWKIYIITLFNLYYLRGLNNLCQLIEHYFEKRLTQI
jgi:hypothetical protein